MVVLKSTFMKLKQDLCIKYLGIHIDSNRCWKGQTNYIAKKLKEVLSPLQNTLLYY